MADPVKEKQGEQAAKDKALASKASKQWTSMKMEPRELKKASPEGTEKIQQGTEDIAEGVEQLVGQPPTAMQTTAVVPAATIDRIEGDMAVVDIGGTTYDIPVAALQALGIQTSEGAALSHSPPPAE